MSLSRVKRLARGINIFTNANKGIVRTHTNNPIKKGVRLRMFSSSDVLRGSKQVEVLSDDKRLQSKIVQELVKASSPQQFTGVNPKIKALIFEDTTLLADTKEAMKLFVWAKEKGLKIGVFTNGSLKDLQEKIKNNDFFSSHVVYLGSLSEVSKADLDPYTTRLWDLAYQMGIGGCTLFTGLIIIGDSVKFMLAAKRLTWTACVTDKLHVDDLKPNCISGSLAGVKEVVGICEQAMTQGRNFVPLPRKM